MYAGKRFTSPFSSMPPHSQSTLTGERGRQRMAGAAISAASYSQPRRPAASRAASSNAWSAAAWGGMSEPHTERRRAASSGGRQRGGYSRKANIHPVGGIASDARRASFTKGMGFLPDGNSYMASSTSIPNSYSQQSSNENGYQVRHLLSELVEISQALAAYLQDGSPPRMQQPQQASPRSVNGGAKSGPHSQQQATLKAQEIERIVKRVESHFAAKIASMEQREKEQAAVIAELRKELRRYLQQEGPISTTLPAGKNRDLGTSSRPDLHPAGAAYGARTTTTTTATTSNGAAGDVHSEQVTEVEHLRCMLQEEKRQRLFVEEQTQSLSEQHGRVVMTLERRLQKQEEQLRELIASLDHRAQFAPPSPNSRSPAASQLSHAAAVTSPRLSLRQQLTQHEQAQRAFDTYHQNPRGAHGLNTSTRDTLSADNSRMNPNRDTGAALDGDDFLVDLGLAEPKPGMRTESDPHKSGQEAVTSSLLKQSPPQPKSREQYQEQQRSQQQLYSVKHATNVMDADATKAAAEVDDIAAFLDNITQELESIDALGQESEGEI
ncbi:uncharacterized protein Tco025E_02181 [Trypanosoma conorhini]|uniref:Uncharacterized protein n=1 Tax=Trypanosoma conorhini TaxID=83891 RepID=A0A422Q6L0_9TRYP|nr:uncharacterized protein Tco025E_02181 [Trypanosoma conorhini]RNF25592.1 hypothetical protein Tco025E_02181 [Trypanosoma conorhini]